MSSPKVPTSPTSSKMRSPSTRSEAGRTSSPPSAGRPRRQAQQEGEEELEGGLSEREWDYVGLLVPALLQGDKEYAEAVLQSADAEGLQVSKIEEAAEEAAEAERPEESLEQEASKALQGSPSPEPGPPPRLPPSSPSSGRQPT